MVTLFVNILEANPFIRVASRDADLEVGHRHACKPGPVEFFDSMEDERAARSELFLVLRWRHLLQFRCRDDPGPR